MSAPKMKRHYTLEEKKKYCEAFRESKLSAEAFCKMNGISKATLYKWNKNVGEESESGLSSSGFSAILLKEPPVPTEEWVTTELRLSSGAVFSLKLKESQLLSLVTRMVQ